MKFKRQNEGVYYGDEPIVEVSAADVDLLERYADAAARKRSRLCTHPSPEDGSNRFVYHETTTGPFLPETTEFAAWAPADDGSDAAQRYVASLEENVAAFLRRSN